MVCGRPDHSFASFTAWKDTLFLFYLNSQPTTFDHISRGDNGEVLKVYPVGSEGHTNYCRALDLFARVAQRRLDETNNKKKECQERIDLILDKPDKKILQRAEQRKLKRYNLSQTAMILKVPRQTLYYWIKKGWIEPRRDSRSYPIFTVFDIESIMKWRHTISSDREPNV